MTRMSAKKAVKRSWNCGEESSACQVCHKEAKPATKTRCENARAARTDLAAEEWSNSYDRNLD